MTEEQFIRAPFTPEQVEALNAYQHARLFHPFTCVNREGHAWNEEVGDYGPLVATAEGWVCAECDYTQTWAWAFMADRQVIEKSVW